jgi:chromosomal replication initiation ATPase DnaA
MRRRDLVIKRQIVSYVCRAAGFQFHHIARAMDINHATVIHGVHSVKNLIETKEPEFLQIYEDIMAILNTYHREKYGKDLSQID